MPRTPTASQMNTHPVSALIATNHAERALASILHAGMEAGLISPDETRSALAHLRTSVDGLTTALAAAADDMAKELAD